MKGIIAGLGALLVVLGCTAGPKRSPAETRRVVDLGSYFSECAEGCFFLLDRADGEITVYNPERCRQTFSPCSTFKVPHSLIALDSGVISGVDHRLPWDGERRSRAVLNRDHTLRSAVQDSVIWYFKEVATRVGAARMQTYLSSIPYGNEDLSSGLTGFWLDGSLAISAEEQAAFLSRLQDGELPFSTRTMETVREILVLSRDGDTVLRGKTGSGGKGAEEDLGWFVGGIEGGGADCVFACNVSGTKSSWPGGLARRITESILRDQGRLPSQPSGDAGF